MITRQIEVRDSIHQTTEAVLNMARTCKTALADGWQIGQDAPGIAMNAISNLPVIFGNREKLMAEVKEDIPGAITAAGIFLGDLARILIK